MEQKIRQSMEQQCFKRGYAAPADVLMDIGTLERKSYDAWRAGRVPFLESVCHANLHKLAEMLKIMRNVAAQRKWNPSVTVYKHKSLTLRSPSTEIRMWRKPIPHTMSQKSRKKNLRRLRMSPQPIRMLNLLPHEIRSLCQLPRRALTEMKNAESPRRFCFFSFRTRSCGPFSVFKGTVL